MDSNWRAALAQDSRQKIVNRIMDTLPASGRQNKLRKITLRFEEKTFQAATDKHDYLLKISRKILSLENKAQNGPNNPLSTSSNGATQNTVKPLDPGTQEDELSTPLRSETSSKEEPLNPVSNVSACNNGGSSTGRRKRARSRLAVSVVETSKNLVDSLNNATAERAE